MTPEQEIRAAAIQAATAMTMDVEDFPRIVHNFAHYIHDGDAEGLISPDVEHDCSNLRCPWSRQV